MFSPSPGGFSLVPHRALFPRLSAHPPPNWMHLMDDG